MAENENESGPATPSSPTVFRPQPGVTTDVTNLTPPPGSSRRRRVAKKRTGPFVQYVGPATHRRIGPTHWKSLGLEEIKDDKAAHEWSIKNDKLIEASEFSDEQLDYLLIDDLQRGTRAHSFLMVDYDNNGVLHQVTDE